MALQCFQNATREQLASLNLPPVKSIAIEQIEVVTNPDEITNPATLPFRVPQSVLDHCYRLLNAAEDNNDADLEVFAVRLSSFGMWARHYYFLNCMLIYILEKVCFEKA